MSLNLQKNSRSWRKANLNRLKWTLLIVLFTIPALSFAQRNSRKDEAKPTSDRAYWVDMLYRIAQPVLSQMAEGKLQQNMTLELSPIWDGRDTRVAYLETFGRLMAGVAPWLNLPDDNSEEGKKRAQIRKWALKSYANGVDPESPDYLHWNIHSQNLVDAAYLAESFLRCPSLWQSLDATTQQRYVKEFKSLRTILTPYNNWLLFRAMVEAFLLNVGEEADGYALGVATRKISEWYLSDGFYSDGPEFSLDYYNSYVIHPMFIEVLEVMEPKGLYAPVKKELALRRMQRFNQLIERLISPEGTFPAIGRSATYRMGAFQSLAMSAWKYGLPEGMTNGQVRHALTTVMKNMFGVEGNFNKEGFLQLGFAGHQPDLADYYTNNGSLYMTSLVFLPLGLPESHPFWSDPAEDWTSRKAWSGRPFRKDYHESVRN
ncbi:DUF2264 domain-containing protein [uncultured Bacteroides sp.]|jgi:hypothetical protein|uniref:DUF2264 domain-containing protein n=1 Tax=uncultured Bacteroides sp. TaxID=162156 RepID=UPI0025D2953E|nr:DUF2264 domain-containing protein [uncultured Bacteroides sp.]